MTQPICGIHIESLVSDIDGCDRELRVPVRQWVDGDQYELDDVGLRNQFPRFPLPLPCVIKPLKAIDLLLKLLRQLVVEPLSLLIVAYCDRTNYKEMRLKLLPARMLVMVITNLTKESFGS